MYSVLYANGENYKRINKCGHICGEERTAMYPFKVNLKNVKKKQKT